MKPIISPSLMCMDFLDIRRQVQTLNHWADMFHFDIMDGHFVPNLALSPDMAGAIARVSEKPLDFHLMVTNPERYIEPCRKAAAALTEHGVLSFFSPHAEVLSGIAFRIIRQLRSAGFRPGVAVNPETPLACLTPYLHLLDKVTFLCVDPGFAAQPFIPEVLDKIRQAKALRDAEPEKYHFIIECDGACSPKTYRQMAAAGAEAFVEGTSGLFRNDPDLEKACEIMRADFEREIGGPAQ